MFLVALDAILSSSEAIRKTLITLSVCVCVISEQRCLRECMELDVLHPAYNHWLLLHAQPGTGCVVRVSVFVCL